MVCSIPILDFDLKDLLRLVSEKNRTKFITQSTALTSYH